MKRKAVLAMLAGLTGLLLCAGNAYAAIEDPADYMGEWYANYICTEENGKKYNVAGDMEVYGKLTLLETGNAFWEISDYSIDPDDAELTKGTWELEDGKIVVTLDSETVCFEEKDGELAYRNDVGYMVWGRELIQEGPSEENQEETEESEEQTDEEKANTPKENPYVYDPEEDDLADLISLYLTASNWGDKYEAAIDEELGTFTADWPGDEYSDPVHYEGTYEVTEDNYVNLKWYNEAYDYEDSIWGKDCVRNWDDYTVKEDLSNLDDVVAAMVSVLDYEHSFRGGDVSFEEMVENEGVALLEDRNYQVTYDYKIVPGVDPMVYLYTYNEEYDYQEEYTNYRFRDSL